MPFLHPYGYNFMLFYRFYTLSGAKVLLFFDICKFFSKKKYFFSLIEALFSYLGNASNDYYFAMHRSFPFKPLKTKKKCRGT